LAWDCGGRIEWVEVEGFRGLRRFSVSGLRLINVLLGRNKRREIQPSGSHSTRSLGPRLPRRRRIRPPIMARH